MSQYAHLSTPDPEFLELASKLPAAPQGPMTVANVYPTHSPGERNAGFPVLVWIHGGGWVAGNLDMDDFNLRMVSVELRLSIVNVDYRLAPEHVFPTGLKDCYTALKWVRFLVGGVSAGGNLSAALVHRARDELFFTGRRITGQILKIPALLHPAAYRRSRAHCLQADPADPDLSPLLSSYEDIPPSYIQIAGLDPLRDEAFLYERLVGESGTKTRLDIYPGLPHGFYGSCPGLKASRRFQADFRRGIEWLLAQV
ncbi:Alpha/Beta hydrolase protein [Mycena epipterygia]|nr:Alpha/Beta hydrolase protein [Mycena epipterygia]